MIAPTEEKVIALLRYIGELYKLKTKTIIDIEQYRWILNIDDIMSNKHISFCYIDNIEDERDDIQSSKNEEKILSIKKPTFDPCPILPQELSGWILEGWDKFNKDFQVLEKRQDEQTGDEEFLNGNTQRERALSEWKDKRIKWCADQKEKMKIRNLFNDLYQNYRALERDSESIELLVGDGILKENTSQSKYNHPLLLKKVKMSYDVHRDTISILDTDTDPELYMMLINELPDTKSNELELLVKELSEKSYHPLDRVDTPAFLKRITTSLSIDSRFLLNLSDKVSEQEKLLLYSRPVFFIRKKISGVIKTVEEAIEKIESDGIRPGPFVNIVGDQKSAEFPDVISSENIGNKLATLNGEDKEILLAKEANDEQLEIARRIEKYDAVLVQGPPGTGKTHTIANLLGHFISQGKRVLVTSHTKKALSVLKEKLPKEIQDLCVSVLDDSKKDMERSIDGITDIVANNNSFDLLRAVDAAKREREKCIDHLNKARSKIHAIKHREMEQIAFNGAKYSISTMAKFVGNNFTKFSEIIPGNIKMYAPLPLTLSEIEFLYKTNGEITEKEERDLKLSLPKLESLFTLSEYKNLLEKREYHLEEIQKIGAFLQKNIEIDSLKGLLIEGNIFAIWKEIDQLDLIEKEYAKCKISINKTDDEWLLTVIRDGKSGGGYKEIWDKFVHQIRDVSDFSEKTASMRIGKKIIIADYLLTDEIELIKKLEEIKRKYEKGQTFTGFMSSFFNRSLQKVIKGIFINDSNLSSIIDCELIKSSIVLERKRRTLELMWEELVTNRGGKPFSCFGEEPERYCASKIFEIENALDWYPIKYTNLRLLLEKSGINNEIIFESEEKIDDIESLKRKIYIVNEHVEQYILLAKSYMSVCEIETFINLKKESLQHQGKELFLVKDLLTSLEERDLGHYSKIYSLLKEYHDKDSLLLEREQSIKRIKDIAPDWGDHISKRIGIHGDIAAPSEIFLAWQWKQFNEILNDLNSFSFEELQEQYSRLLREFKEVTTRLIVKKSWYFLTKGVEGNPEKQRALQGWRQTIRKIGKGKGKNADNLRREAKKLMADCQSAVPAWIMPISVALETLDPKSNQFDVVLIDEASQSDISVLVILFFGKKVIIVGDDEQVSPTNMIDNQKVAALRALHIEGIIPNAHLYDLQSSIYDIAKLSFPMLMLKEHFRCVPEIIGFSNKLAYNFRIKPLRDSSSSNLKPATIVYQTDGIRGDNRPINTKEALVIIALIVACIEQPEYMDSSFGVISLLADEQVELLTKIATEKISPVLFEKHSILFGNAAQFQGDERDVVFLSMVDSGQDDGPNRLKSENNKLLKQRYNVAASRAKDQLWLIHSFSPNEDLKVGDMRRDLIEYMADPNALSHVYDQIEHESESPFEEEVAKHLSSKGYQIRQQRRVGSYRIDMVAIYDGKEIAIECDGDRYHSGEEKIFKDMERQTVLERLGWQFIRIRGSDYYRSPDQTMQRVFQRLEKLGIYPVDNTNFAVKNESSNELTEKVKIRAYELLKLWDESEEMLTPIEHANERISILQDKQI